MKYRRDMCGEIVEEKAVVVCLLVGTESKFKVFDSNDENCIGRIFGALFNANDFFILLS